MSEVSPFRSSNAREPTPVRPEHAATVHLTVNNSDFVIVFGRIMPFFGQEGLTNDMAIEPVTAVSLSPITAKQLMRMLSKALLGFEQHSGAPIPETGTFEPDLEEK